MLGELTKSDIIQRLQPVLNAGWYVNTKTGKVTMSQAGIATNLPWVFVKFPEKDMSCKFFHDVCHTCFNLIHSRCMTCWKVVFRPKTIEELFIFHGIMQNELSDIPSKLGVERRPYVFGNYGCYFYGASNEEGLENWERVRKAVSNHNGLRHLLRPKDNEGRTKNLILKRACTEFEMSHGNSSKWAHTEEDDYWEKLIEETVEKPDTSQPQPKYVVDHIIKGWLKFAYDRGDLTALNFNNGEMFYPDYVKYHPRSKK